MLQSRYSRLSGGRILLTRSVCQLRSVHSDSHRLHCVAGAKTTDGVNISSASGRRSLWDRFEGLYFVDSLEYFRAVFIFKEMF